ncbi:unnamed protein product [Heligmosomoides polygyrus]|uniref:Uncharacterized protein n=1 Tax=Heligmosomoides polygyrus TaxID=6339 RepID=A0A183G1A4_HELPZ|nr:unnamed protein product [Heligmosomoides polygyrus]
MSWKMQVQGLAVPEGASFCPSHSVAPHHSVAYGVADFRVQSERFSALDGYEQLSGESAWSKDVLLLSRMDVRRLPYGCKTLASTTHIRNATNSTASAIVRRDSIPATGELGCGAVDRAERRKGPRRNREGKTVREENLKGRGREEGTVNKFDSAAEPVLRSRSGVESASFSNPPSR